MGELEQLRISVLEQAHRRGKLNLQRSCEKLEENYNKANQAQIDHLEETYHQKHAAMSKEYERKIQQIKNKRRQTALSSKQAILTELFAGAIDAMNHWSRDRQLEFLNQVLPAYAEEDTEIQLAEMTDHVLSEEDKQDLLSKYPHLKLNDEVISGEGGFVLTQGKIIYNYIYRRLVEETKKDYNTEVANQIFN